MSFQLFIYYCAVAGGWAAFAAAAVALGGVSGMRNKLLEQSLIGALLGAFVGAAVGTADAILNDKGAARFARAALCAVLGLLGGAVGALVGQVLLENAGVPLFVGWMLAGTLIGASLGAFDLFRDGSAGVKKVLNGVVGGAAGGLLGGVLFGLVRSFPALTEGYPNSSLIASLVLLGALIGLSIGLAQVILKEAWLKVEEGSRAGRELMLTKETTTIGRSEACDLGLFGDNTIQRVHARIVLRAKRYHLEHAADEGETFLNGEPIGGPAALSAGDRIRVGKCVLKFGERQKRK